MNTSTAHMAVSARTCAGTPLGAAGLGKAGPGKLRRAAKKARQAAERGMVAAERGMATAEYAVGILAAVALALVMLKVFNAGTFLDTIAKVISSIFSKILGWLP